MRNVTPADMKRAQETCAPCHARNELLTGELRPGVAYHDYYRLTLPTEPAVFYPDGQMRDEDFNYTSLLTSRMGGKAGVTCLDCHDPHSGRTKLPVENNALCLQCHGPSPRNNAPIIDPLAHSHHAADNKGSQCVSCHMPTTTYMQRDPRHDHGFTKPDPLLTKELGITIGAVHPWKVELVDYPHALVRLNFCKVFAWSGELQMRESQAFAWERLPVAVTPVLPGTVPVLTWFAQEQGFAGATHSA